MQQSSKRRLTSKLVGTAALTLLCAAPFSAQACPVEPYISSVCVMAWNKTGSFGNSTYYQANGALLPIASYTALFSLLGVTYGGNGTTNFQLPDLRGRMIVGVGQGTGLPLYNFGQYGGAVSVTLTAAQMPAHTHTLTTAPGKVATTFALGSLVATTSLSPVTASASASGLALNATNSASGTGTPGGAALANTGLTKTYLASTTPNVAMAAGSISGSAPVTFSGNPTTTLSGAPTITVSGVTDSAGTGSAVSTLPPFLAMTYYIAVNGVFPVLD